MISVVPLTPTIGAEIKGADLARMRVAGESESDFAIVRQALIDHQVIFFRDQAALEPAIQVKFARRFGDLHQHPAAPHLAGHPEIFVIHAHRESKVANGNGWHTDVSCDLEPPMATMLQIHELPESGGDTLFSSMYAAFASLSPVMQSFLSTLTATHSSEHIYRGRYSDRGVDDTDRSYPSASHPVVRTHPESGRPALYVNPSFTSHINELSADESQALLAYLYRHQERPEFQVRFHWSQNAIAFWDNRCTQHCALWDYWPSERKGHRVTIKGERPFLDTQSLDIKPASNEAMGRLMRLSRHL